MAISKISLPTRQTAIVAQGPGKLTIRHDVPVPVLGEGMAIVKTAAVAINPADAKMLDYSAAIGAIHGYDFAGTIVALASDLPKHVHLAIGDRVAGLAHGNNSEKPGSGGFSEYIGVDADLLLRLPDNMSFGEGASLGTGVGTALLCIFRELEVPASLEKARPTDSSTDADFVLVAGGSTATGTRAIQLLKL
jgi:NADPH:quinone reductase-like Zn-dependent oxidoreductase